MKAAFQQHRARGAMVLELALILLLTYSLAPCVLTVGRAMRQQMVLEKATYEAASRLAALPRLQMGKLASYQQAEVAVRSQALARLDSERVDTAELIFNIVCDPICGTSAIFPQRISVKMALTVQAAQWDSLSGFLLGGNGLLLQSEVVLRYEN